MLKLRGAWLCGLSSVPQGSDLSRLRSSVFIGGLVGRHLFCCGGGGGGDGEGWGGDLVDVCGVCCV